MVTPRHQPCAELAQAAGLNMAAWWRPTAEDYFRYIAKPAIPEAVGQFAPAHVTRLSKLKKGDIANEAKRLAEDTGCQSPAPASRITTRTYRRDLVQPERRKHHGQHRHLYCRERRLHRHASYPVVRRQDQAASQRQGRQRERPDFRLQAAGHDIGATWKKISEAMREYLSVTLEDPLFPATVFASLIESEDGTPDLIWSRSKPTGGLTAAHCAPPIAAPSQQASEAVQVLFGLTLIALANFFSSSGNICCSAAGQSCINSLSSLHRALVIAATARAPERVIAAARTCISVCG